MFESEGWQGCGWYTISRGVSLVDDFAAAKRNADVPEYVDVEYHGCDTLPDECLSQDPNSWCDVDPNFLEDPLYYLMCDLADAKTQGTHEDIRKALDAIEAYACEF